MNDNLKRIARRRAGAKLGLYIHAGVYIAVNAFLAVVKLQTTPQIHWNLWPLAGWGLGLAVHRLSNLWHEVLQRILHRLPLQLVLVRKEIRVAEPEKTEGA